MPDSSLNASLDVASRIAGVFISKMEFKMIEICNLRNNKPVYEFDVRVDRSNKILGNKFIMRNESERELVCKQYEIWLYERVGLQDVDIINELQRLSAIYKKYGRLRLFCWCAPKKCHAETIKELLLKI